MERRICLFWIYLFVNFEASLGSETKKSVKLTELTFTFSVRLYNSMFLSKSILMLGLLVEYFQ